MEIEVLHGAACHTQLQLCYAHCTHFPSAIHEQIIVLVTVAGELMEMHDGCAIGFRIGLEPFPEPGLPFIDHRFII